MADEVKERGSLGGFAGHAATYAIGNIARRLVGFLMLPIYTRFLTPADYGAIGLLTFALAFLEPLFGARLGRAVPIFYFAASNDRGRRAVVWSALSLTGVVSALTMIVLILFRDPASQELFGTHRYALATGLFAVNMLTQPIEGTGMMYLRLLERSRLFLGVSMAKLGLQVALNLLLVVHLKLSVEGVVLSGIVASAAVGAGLTLYIAWQCRPAFDQAMMRVMLRYCWPLWFAGLAELYIGSSGAVYLRALDSLHDVGLLELGLRFALVVGVLIWTPFFQQWEPVSYRYHREEGGRKKFQAAFAAMSALMFIAATGVSIFSEPTIKLMAAPAFHAAAPLVPTLTLGLVLYNLVSFFYFSFLVTQRTKSYSYSQYLTAAILTVAYCALIPRFGVEGAAFAQCIALAINFVYVHFWSRRYYDPGFDLVPICMYFVIGLAAYECANVFVRAQGLAADLAIKTLIMVVAAGLVAVIGLRSIRKVNPAAYENLLLSVRRGRLALLAK